MSLSDIKFKYLDKIDKVDSRIEKYQSIINNYQNTIEHAEKEETQNISSVLKSKEQYEKRIEALLRIKQDCQEYVDTADYLMQNLNNKESFQLISQNEELIKQNALLTEKVKELEMRLNEKDEVEARAEKRNERDKKTIQQLRENYNCTINSLKKEIMLAKTKAKNDKQLKSETRKLRSENKMLRDTNEFLENKLERMEEYCNDLLNRDRLSTESDPLLIGQYEKLVNGESND